MALLDDFNILRGEMEAVLDRMRDILAEHEVGLRLIKIPSSDGKSNIIDEQFVYDDAKKNSLKQDYKQNGTKEIKRIVDEMNNILKDGK